MKKHGKLMALVTMLAVCFGAQAQPEPGDDLTSLITNASCTETASGETSTADRQLTAANWRATNGKGVIVNTWSNEGDTDGSGMTVPFAQNWDWVNLPDGEVCHDPINGLTPGIYRVTCLARIFGASEDLYGGLSGVSLYANDNSLDLSEGEKCKSGGLYGYYGTYSVDVPVLNGTLNFGFRLEGAKSSWVAFKNFTLTYLESFDDAEARDLLMDFVAECEAKYPNLGQLKANREVKATYAAALEKAKGATSDYAQYQTTLGQAVQNLELSVADYERFVKIIEEARRLASTLAETNNFGPVRDELNTLADGWAEDYEQGAATSEEIRDARSEMRGVMKNGILEYMNEGDDITLLVDNDECTETESGEASTVDRQLPAANWKATNGKGVIVNTWSNEGDTDGSGMTVPFAQNWDWVNLPDGVIIHDPIKGLPAGTYRVTCQARIFGASDELYEGTTGVSLFANENSVDLSVGQRCLSGGLRGYYDTYSIDVMVNDGKLEFGFVLNGAKSSWVAFKNFTLTYLQGMDNAMARKALGDVIYEANALTGESMYSEVSEMLNNEIEKATSVYESTELDADSYNAAAVALTEKMNVARRSVEDYKKIEVLIGKSENLDEEGQKAFAPTIDAYDARSIADYATAQESYFTAVKAQTTPGCDMTEAIANAACNEKPASAVENWSSNSIQLVVNTWSNEGETDGSGMTVPFAQYWSDAILPNGIVKHDPIGGLRKAYYTIEVSARILDWTGDVYANDETNVKFYANEKTVDMGTGLRCQTGALFGFYDKYSITLLIEDGTLDFGFVLDNPHCTWLSFKNVKLTYLGTEVPDNVKLIDDATRDYREIYNLSGMKVTRMERGGIYISHGKKILVK